MPIANGDKKTGLNHSPLTPKGMWFGVAWTILYFLMALAAARIAKISGQWNNRPLRWWLEGTLAVSIGGWGGTACVPARAGGSAATAACVATASPAASRAR